MACARLSALEVMALGSQHQPQILGIFKPALPLHLLNFRALEHILLHHCLVWQQSITFQQGLFLPHQMMTLSLGL